MLLFSQVMLVILRFPTYYYSDIGIPQMSLRIVISYPKSMHDFSKCHSPKLPLRFPTSYFPKWFVIIFLTFFFKSTDASAKIGHLLKQLADQQREYQSVQELKMQMDMEIAVYRRLLETEEDRMGVAGGGRRDSQKKN